MYFRPARRLPLPAFKTGGGGELPTPPIYIDPEDGLPGQYCPARHSSHEGEPAELLPLPAGQYMQDVEPGLLYVPAGHKLQDDEPTAATVMP